MPKCDWLDTMAFRKMGEIHAVRWPIIAFDRVSQLTSRFIQAETEKSENLFLYIDLPRFDFPVIFSEAVRALCNPITIAFLTH